MLRQAKKNNDSVRRPSTDCQGNSYGWRQCSPSLKSWVRETFGYLGAAVILLAAVTWTGVCDSADVTPLPVFAAVHRLRVASLAGALPLATAARLPTHRARRIGARSSVGAEALGRADRHKGARSATGRHAKLPERRGAASGWWRASPTSPGLRNRLALWCGRISRRCAEAGPELTKLVRPSALCHASLSRPGAHVCSRLATNVSSGKPSSNARL